MSCFCKELKVQWWAAAVLLFCVVGVAQAVQPRDAAVDPFQPVVTRQEAALLEEALDISQTNRAAAISHLREAVNEESSAALDYALGNFLFQQEELEAATAAYRAALDKMPLFRRARENLGRVYLLQDQPEKTIVLYQELVEDGQASADILLLLGHALLMQDAPVSAETAYRQVLLLRPEQAEAMTGLARTLIMQERYQEALALLREILHRHPVNRELWVVRANALLAMDRQDDAVRCLEQARRLDCANAEMLATLGDLYLNRTQPEDAVAVYRLAFAQDAASPQRMLRAVEGLLMLERLDEAADMITLLEERVGDDPNAALHPADTQRLLRLKGNLARLRGRLSEAEEVWRSLLRQDPLDADTMLLLGDLLHEQDQFEQALIQYEQAARINGYEARALARQAQLEVQRGRYPRAVTLLERAQAFDEKPHIARYLEQVRRLQ
jgi:tetratricopeptide (TPR) repeat protein